MHVALISWVLVVQSSYPAGRTAAAILRFYGRSCGQVGFIKKDRLQWANNKY